MSFNEAYDDVNCNNMRVAAFSKVSFGKWLEVMTAFDAAMLPRVAGIIYEKLKLPERATICSAGYDIRTPVAFNLGPGETIKIPTGIRCSMQNKYFLALLPRSSVGMKHDITLMNTMGIVDADYYFADNEGHIMLAFKNNQKKSIFPWINEKRTWRVKAGDRVCQGILIPYGITYDDHVNTERKGGMGSTGK